MARTRRRDRPRPLFAALPLFALSTTAAASPPTFSADPPVTILSSSQMQGFGLLFPDTSPSFLKTPAGSYVVYAGGGGVPAVGGSAATPFGTYAFAGTLDSIAPVRSARRRPIYAMTRGAVEPSPDGSDFDRDYAAGGQTIRIPGSTKLLQVYHGEHRCSSEKGLPAVGGLGMAVSDDGGYSFHKIGQIISPRLASGPYCASGQPGGLWVDGWMIEADGDGRRTGAGDAYVYILFVDHEAVDHLNRGISIARVGKAALLAAVAAGKSPPFLKYYNPTGAPGPAGAFFTEPGLGGRSTPVVASDVFIGSPTLAYDADRRCFVLAYQEQQKRILLRSGETLFAWSPAQPVFAIDPQDELRLFYPSLVGLRDDPTVLDRQFYLYFLERRPHNLEPRMVRITVTGQ